jgi:hypothetical protein
MNSLSDAAAHVSKSHSSSFVGDYLQIRLWIMILHVRCGVLPAFGFAPKNVPARDANKLGEKGINVGNENLHVGRAT